MEKRDPELQVVIKKLATLTLLEVFKDLLPSYQLKLDKHDGVKCKFLVFLDNNIFFLVLFKFFNVFFVIVCKIFKYTYYILTIFLSICII